MTEDEDEAVSGLLDMATARIESLLGELAKARQESSNLHAAIQKVRAGYESQMKFCDIEALGYFREFVRRLDAAIKQSGYLEPRRD